MDNIDCNIPCHYIIKSLSSCPISKNISFFEIFLIILSLLAYPCVFLLCLGCLIFRTTRLGFLVVMVFADYFLVEILKNYLKEKRPNFKCNQEYGNPSNHAFVSSSIVIWMILEKIFIKKEYENKCQFIVYSFCILFPFLLYSRYYLYYHSIKQIMIGTTLGCFFGIIYFSLTIKVLIKSVFIQKFYLLFNIENNLTDDDPIKDRSIKKH